MTNRGFVITIFFFVFTVAPAANAQDWTQWRGPGRDGFVSGTRQGTHAYAIAEKHGKWQATELWKNPDVAMYMSSPVFADGVVYAHSAKKKGQFVAFDAKSGAVRWATEGREGEHASLLLTPRHVVFLTNGADLIVTKRGTPAFAAERRYEVAESSTWSMPVLLGSNILVRDATGLMLLTGK